MLDLSIVIVSYHVKDYLEKCLGSIYSNTEHLHFEILVVDNCSQDGSPEMVKRLYPEVRLIENGTNQGFSKANNQAIAQSKGRYILLLNPDTEIFAEALAEVETRSI